MSFSDLILYKKSFALAMEIFETSRLFPKQETYSLTDQIRRSSRSVCANLAEAYRRKRYPAHFLSKMGDCDSENSETLVWLEFCYQCGYISNKEYEGLCNQAHEIGKIIGDIIRNPDQFTSQ